MGLFYIAPEPTEDYRCFQLSMQNDRKLDRDVIRLSSVFTYLGSRLYRNLKE